MSLSIGIVGLPNVGKSTLFNALLKKQQALAANYPFATIEPNVGIVPVPDERLEKLAAVVKSDKIVPATVTFTDIAGIVKGASEGQGLGNKFLAHIREADVICLVVRAFEDVDVIATGSGNVKNDADVLMTELALADLQTIGKQTPPKGQVKPEQKRRYELILAIGEKLNTGQRADAVVMTTEERLLVKDLNLLTMKPVIFVINVAEKTLTTRPVSETKAQYAKELGLTETTLPTGYDADAIIVISAKVEAELAELADKEQAEYLFSLGFSESGLQRLIRVAYKALGLQAFLTAGEKEVRAWTIRTGDTALRASAVIHTDFAKRFIKAAVVNWELFVLLGGWKAAYEKGVVRLEGKEYVMQEGDLVEFKIG